MIEISNLSKTFISGKSSLKALKNINLKIKEGEFIAIIGPSGSGKSTLLNIIGGLDQASQGDIKIKNKKISNYKDKELSKYRNDTIGFIFQEFHLENYLTVKQNVLLPTFFSENKKDKEKKAEKLIKEVGLKTKEDSNVNELSGGQKQRVAMARSLINNPKILLADEPTGNLDQKTGEKIIRLLQNLHKKHKVTLIIATHDPKIAKVAKKIIHIKDGKLC